MPGARLTAGVGLAVALAACAPQAVQGPQDAAEPEPASEVFFPRLPPGSLGRTLEREQHLRLTAGDRQTAFQCVVRVSPAQLVVIGLAPVGTRLFTLAWDGRELKTEAAGEAPPPERMLADLQMAYWPLPVLEVAIAGTAWSVREPQPGVRQVLRAGEPWAEIRYGDAAPWDGRLSLANVAQGYALEIDSRPLGP